MINDHQNLSSAPRLFKVVSGVAPGVQTTESHVGTLIENKMVKEAPLNGRNFLQLQLLSPAVVTGKDSTVTFGVQAFGTKVTGGFSLKVRVTTNTTVNTSIFTDSLDEIHSLFGGSLAEKQAITLDKGLLKPFEGKIRELSGSDI